MTRSYSIPAVLLTTVLALAVGTSVSAQTKNQTGGSRSASTKATNSGQSAGPGFGVTESLSGKIQMVVADQNLLVIQGPNNVPYDLKVTPKCIIVVGVQRGTIESLADQVGKSVSVGFVPQRNGNFATRIEVTE